MKMLLLASFALLVSAAGCDRNCSVRGWIADQATENTQMDYVFTDDQGNSGPLPDMLSDYTVLALTRCDKATHGSAADVLETIVRENRLPSSVKIVGVDAHYSDGPCNRDDTCHVVEERADLVSFCDTEGALRRLYADGRDDRLVVLGPRERVIFSSPIQDTGELRQEHQELHSGG